MIIDIGPLLRGEVRGISIDYTLTPEPLRGVEFAQDARVRGSITDNAGYMQLALRAELPYVAECARCLCEVRGVYGVDFVRTLVTPGMLTEERLAENIDEYVLVEDGRLDIDGELSEWLLLEFPTKLLCSEDCEGLCQVCGNPKREGCGCVERYIDPRLAPLAKLLEDDGEDK